MHFFFIGGPSAWRQRGIREEVALFQEQIGGGGAWFFRLYVQREKDGRKETTELDDVARVGRVEGVRGGV